jgi:hypothetical protein
MSQLIQITFNEAVPVGDEVYPKGYVLTLPAEQAFGAHSRRRLAPFDLFDSGLELVTDLDGGFYRLAYDMEISIGVRTIRQSDLFYYEIPTQLAFGWLVAMVNENGSFTIRQSDISILTQFTSLKPGASNDVQLTFFYQGGKVTVTGPNLTSNGDGSYTLTVVAPTKPGSWQYNLKFTCNGIDYEYPLSLSVMQPGLTITNVTPSLKAGELGMLLFTIERQDIDSLPDVKLINAAIDGGTAGELHLVHDNVYGLEVTPKDVVFTMNVRLTLSLDGWIVPWSTYVVVTQKDASSEVIEGGVLTFNLTQVVKIRVVSEGKPVPTLTTKSLSLSGSPSYHTYAKTLVKVEDGLYQFSIYTNNIAGTMYADIVVTIDGVDLALPRFPITVRA